MKRIYNYTPQTNHVSRVYRVVVILYLQFMAHLLLFPLLNVLYFYISTFRSTYAEPNMAVFCSCLISCFPGMLLGCFLNDFKMVPVAPIITIIFYLYHRRRRTVKY
jgi:hypothetical protein